MFEKLGKGKAPVEFPVLVEIDRGTMYRERFKKRQELSSSEAEGTNGCLEKRRSWSPTRQPVRREIRRGEEAHCAGGRWKRCKTREERVGHGRFGFTACR